MSWPGLIHAMALAAQVELSLVAKELFPGVRLLTSTLVSGHREVEFDAQMSPMLVKDDRAPLFYLEVLCCTPNTREHETILVTSVKPSNVHAAMLAAGFSPGSPGTWTLENNALIAHPPRGDTLRVEVRWTSEGGEVQSADPLDWITTVGREQKRFESAPSTFRGTGVPAQSQQSPGWIFAGSKFTRRSVMEPDGTMGPEREVYDADGTGTLIGLTTFGTETIGWSRVISPDAGTQEPEWIADFARIPPASTKVVVRVSRVGG